MNSGVLVIGRESQLGKVMHLFKPDWGYLSRADLDLSQLTEIKNVLRTKPKILINFAAFTGVDLAEQKRDEALLINATAVGELAKYCEHFIHVSTDYVFSGVATSANSKNSPYLETDPTDPVNFYGLTKLQGEQLAFKNNKNSYIFRTSWLYSAHNVNFVKRMLELGRQREKSGEPLKVVHDQRGSPTYAVDLVRTIIAATDEIIKNSSEFAAGIYHYANEGECSWYEFTQEIFRLKKIKTQVIPITTAEYPTPAKRPRYSVLSKEKIKLALRQDSQRQKNPHWQESLSIFLNTMT